MADRTIITQPGQCLEDIALQEYGSIDGVTELVRSNRAVFTAGYSTTLMPGTTLQVVGAPLDLPMYTTMHRLGVVPATDAGPLPKVALLGSFDTSFDLSFDSQ